MNHTPTPWEVVLKTAIGDKDVVLAHADSLTDKDENEANAAFIVRACNAWDNPDVLRQRIAELEGNK